MYYKVASVICFGASLAHEFWLTGSLMSVLITQNGMANSKRSLMEYNHHVGGVFGLLVAYIFAQAARKNGDESIHFAQIGTVAAIANWLTWVSIQLRKNKKITDGPPFFVFGLVSILGMIGLKQSNKNNKRTIQYEENDDKEENHTPVRTQTNNTKQQTTIDTLQSSLKTVQKEKNEMTTKCNAIEKQLQTTMKSLSNNVKETVDKLRKEIEKSNSVNGNTGKQVNELQSQLDKMTTKLNKTREDFEQFQLESNAKITQLENTIVDLKKKHKDALAKKQTKPNTTVSPPPVDKGLAPAVRWTIKSQCNNSFNEGWYWAVSKGISFEGLADDTFDWQLHRAGCKITPKMEEPSIVGSSVADGIRSHMERFGIGMWSLYDSRGRAIMNGCGDSGTRAHLHSCHAELIKK